MPLLSWLSPFRRKPSPDENTRTRNDKNSLQSEDTLADEMDFETLADRVEDLRSKLDYANELCEQANLQFDKYRIEIHRLKRSIQSERDANINAHRLLAKETQQNAQLQAQARNLQIAVRRETVLGSQLQARFNTETASLRAMTKHARNVEEKLIDTQLDLEHLKCTTSVEPPPNLVAALCKDAPLPAQPFVVVLVDGDAYKWAPDIALNDVHLGTGSACNYVDGAGPGAVAATRIRNEVTKYVLNQNGTIPVMAKIITRVFCNYASMPGLVTNWRKSGPAGVGLAEFAVQFTEKLPLFDFFDAGRGKERADDKIRENFHLFLSTPNCHAIFVAACLDNGFARMLEQYSDHPLAHQKIVLVSPGYVVLEIHRLGLKEVEWPQVFAVRTVPPEVIAKREREKLKLQKQRARMHRSVSTPAVSVGSTPSHVLPRILDMVPLWNPNVAMSKISQGVGFRAPQTRGDVVDSLDLAVEESNEDID